MEITLDKIVFGVGIGIMSGIIVNTLMKNKGSSTSVGATDTKMQVL